MAYPERDNALRLLHALNNVFQANGRTDVLVYIDTPVLERAQLAQGSDELRYAMEWLLKEGALWRDYEQDAKSSGVLGIPDYGLHFYITEHGFDLLNIHPNV
jgi:hypothetical protein